MTHEETGSTTGVLFSSEARKRLFEGMKIAADAVTCTLGPKGKTVIIQHDGHAPVVTKDGVSVSRAIKLKDPVMRMGADLIREAASRTNEVAGDGTTTSTALTYALVEEGMKLLNAGYSARMICEGIESAVTKIVNDLKKNSKKVTSREEIEQIATISANGDSAIGKIIADAMASVGTDGIITVEDAKGMTTSLDVVEGMQFDRGYISPFFVNNNERMNAAYSDALVLVCDKKLNSIKDLVPILEQVVASKRPLLIIADEIEGDALQGLVLNRVKSQLPIVAIKSPGYGQHRSELLSDICTMTGAVLVSSSTGVSLDKLKLKDLGSCKKFIVDAKSTTIVSVSQTKDEIKKRVDELKTQLIDVTLSVEEVSKLKTRIAKLSSGVAVIKVGGLTEIEMIERKYRIEDALNATRAAAEQGIVPGGGMALFYATRTDGESQSLGEMAVYKAALAPLRKIVSNAGLSPDVIIERLRRGRMMSDIQFRGYDAANDKEVDMFVSGIIDPVKVTITAIQNAASVAITFLNLDAVIFDEAVK